MRWIPQLATAALLMFSLPALAGQCDRISGTIDLVDEPPILFNQKVSFDTTVTGRQGPQTDITIILSCEVDDQVVYLWFGQTDFAFPLINQGGAGLEWDGSPAICTASLMCRTRHTALVLGQAIFATE